MTVTALELFPSPLRYPGGKGKIVNYVKLLMLENDMVGIDYVEPYAGGASVALSLLFEDFAGHIHINDLNPGVYAFWSSVLNDTDALCDLIASTNVTAAEWQHQRARRADPGVTDLELGFATFFLNRTNRSGIISGGIIGGRDQAGTYKLDARYNKSDLVRRIRKIGRYRSRITLTNDDALEFIQQWTRPADAQAFLYLDPPYYVKGEGLYDNFYEHEDHVTIAENVAKVTHSWIVSYDAAPEILAIYSGVETLKYDLAYSAAGATIGSEAMFFSPGLVTPRSKALPNSVKRKDVDEARMSMMRCTTV